MIVVCTLFIHREEAQRTFLSGKDVFAPLLTESHHAIWIIALIGLCWPVIDRWFIQSSSKKILRAPDLSQQWLPRWLCVTNHLAQQIKPVYSPGYRLFMAAYWSCENSVKYVSTNVTVDATVGVAFNSYNTETWNIFMLCVSGQHLPYNQAVSAVLNNTKARGFWLYSLVFTLIPRAASGVSHLLHLSYLHAHKTQSGNKRSKSKADYE